MTTATKPKERPILFSSPMVKAILEGKKTQTRRVVKFKKPFERHSQWPYMKPHSNGGWIFADAPIRKKMEHKDGGKQCPYGKPGDRLWVRETWSDSMNEGNREFYYRSGSAYEADPTAWEKHPWKPSIHMPRKASRITLEITNSRVSRLMEMTYGDYQAEGFVGPGEFRKTWDELNSKRGYGWMENPWVWIIEFKRKEASTY